MAFKTTTIFQFWSSNSAQLSSRPTSCKLVTVFIIMFLLAWFVWFTCSMSGFPDVGYTTVAHYTLSGELYTFPSCPRGLLQEKLRLRQSLVLFYAAIGIYHWILFAMLYTLRKIFHQPTSVASYWQKTDIIHMNTKAWLWVNGPWFLFSSSQALQTSWEFLFPFLIRVHCSSTIKTKWNERVYFFITNSTCMHIFCVT